MLRTGIFRFLSIQECLYFGRFRQHPYSVNFHAKQPEGFFPTGKLFFSLFFPTLFYQSLYCFRYEQRRVAHDPNKNCKSYGGANRLIELYSWKRRADA